MSKMPEIIWASQHLVNGECHPESNGWNDFQVGGNEVAYIRKDRYDALLTKYENAVESRQRVMDKCEQAIDRLKDMLQGDDGQAWKEAEKFIARVEND